MSAVAEFCHHLLTHQKTKANASFAHNDDDDDDDDAVDDNEAVFLLSTLCQLHLDVGSGKCSVYNGGMSIFVAFFVPNYLIRLIQNACYE